MRSHNRIRQNQACRALSNLGPSWCAQLPEPVQEQLGRNVLQSAEGDAKDASWLLTRVSFAVDEWPQRFLYGIAVECVVHEHGKLRLKAEARDKVEAILSVRHDGAEIVQAVREAVTAPGTFGKEALLEEAGADALELNVYYVSSSPRLDGAEVERRYLELVGSVRQTIGIPLAVKLSPYFSSVANLAHRLVQAGADGLVLFNRFYQPDLDLDSLEVTPQLMLSTSEELRLPLRWPPRPECTRPPTRSRCSWPGGRGHDDLGAAAQRPRAPAKRRGRPAGLAGRAWDADGRSPARHAQPALGP
jgi:hypothetical protein